MKFLISWRIPMDKRQDALKAFSHMTPEDDKKDMGDKIKLTGRWHDMAAGTGVAVCEADDASDLAGWALNWISVIDLQVVPVLDDGEARAAGRKKFG